MKNFSTWNRLQPLSHDNDDGVDDECGIEGITSATPWPTLAASSRLSFSNTHKKNEKTVIAAKRNQKTVIAAKRERIMFRSKFVNMKE